MTNFQLKEQFDPKVLISVAVAFGRGVKSEVAISEVVIITVEIIRRAQCKEE